MTITEFTVQIAELKKKREAATAIHTTTSGEAAWAECESALMDAADSLLSGMEALVRIAGMPCAHREISPTAYTCGEDYKTRPELWCGPCQARAAIEEMK